MFIDIHSHLYDEKFEDVEKVIKNAEEFHIGGLVFEDL